MSKNMLRLLTFALDYPGWHSCEKDSIRSMNALEALGLVEVARTDKDGNAFQPIFRIRQPRAI